MDKYLVTSHSSIYVLECIKNNNIKVIDFMEEEQYKYSFSSSIFYRNKIRKVFPNIKLISSDGLLSLFVRLWVDKVILISIIISVIFYGYLSSFIWKININGNNEDINSCLNVLLDEYDISKGEKLISNNSLDDIENKIYEEMKDTIEWLEIKRKGCTIDVSYLKRREGVEEVLSRGKLYASRDSMVYRINIDSGNVLVKENQFVRKGDLLVDDVINVSSGGIKNVPTKGYIVGVTWYVIDVEVKKFNDDGVSFEEALSKARDTLNKKVTNIINVRSQNILKYENESSIIRLRIHYEILEDISMEG